MASDQKDSPYQGLVPFTEAQADYFFGRERDTRLIIANLFASPLTVLYGESGVGKSSVLHAGVLHHLRDRKDLLLIYFRDWHGDPVAGFRDAVRQACERAGDGAAPNGASTVLGALNHALKGTDRRAFIVCDQLEEYFTYHTGDAPFAEQLAEAVRQKEMPFQFLLALREDALAKLDAFEDRMPGLFDNMLRIAHLDYAAGKQAITEPLKQFNKKHSAEVAVDIEPGLVSEILKTVRADTVFFAESGTGTSTAATSGAPIEAPYLQLVLTRLWEVENENGWPHLDEKGSRILAWDTLRGLGGAEEIVRKHLQEVMEKKLPQLEHPWAARMFDYLVMPSKTKIAQRLSDLADKAGVTADQLRPMLSVLSDGEDRVLRTVAPTADAPNDPRYEIYHDRLAPAILHWVAEQKKKETAKAVAVETRRKHEEEARSREYQQTLLLLAEQEKVANEQRRRAGAEQARVEEMQHRLAAEEERRATLQTLAEEARRRVEEKGLAIQKLRRLAGVTALFGIVAVGLAVFALLERRQTIMALAAAVLQRERAEEAEALRRAEAAAEVKARIAAEQRIDALVTVLDQLRELKAKPEEPQDKQLLSVYRGHSAAVVTAEFSPDSSQVLTASRDGTAQLWDALSGKRTASLTDDSELVTASFSPDGTRIITGSSNRFVRVWNVKTLVTIFQTDLGSAITKALFSGDGEWFAAGTANGKVGVWSQAGSQPQFLSPDLKGAISDLVFHPAKVKPPILVVCGEQEKQSYLWAFESGKWMSKLDRPFGENGPPDNIATPFILRAALSSTLPIYALADSDGTATTWNYDRSSLRPEATWKGLHDGPLRSVQFDSLGNSIVTAGCDGVAAVWNRGNDKPLAVLKGHSGAVNDAKFSPDGSLVATCGVDKTGRVWDAGTGKELATFKGHDGPVTSINFSANSLYIVTASEDKTARVWFPNVRPEKIKGQEPSALNSLGMEFVPVEISGGPTDGQKLLFCRWETRVQDYATFVQETKRTWPKAYFQQSPIDPAVQVSWEDAQSFCAWLSKRETGKEGKYRLPSDHEWSCAVGIGTAEDASRSPKAKSAQVDGYPWGETYPPTNRCWELSRESGS